ncbi:hypothetical protein MN032_17720 [Agromyces atrinae]|uniref:hypothetical protein n=1 Tax=Agromyces atrinae TaxID=592376 RepID=UPI001F58B5B4|nr:hypothetical protein [Agromyces atrinae]MCI2959527.1 hypothetical protein [Agromyces atrinae]
MPQPITYDFLHMTDKAVIDVNKALGIAPGTPGGTVDSEATQQELVNHEALVDLTRAVEGLHNWAVELTHRLEAAGVVEIVHE